MIEGVYYNPTKILFGKKTESLIGNEVVNYSHNILLHYGQGSIKKSGLYDRVMNALESEGIKITELGGVQSNPRASLVYEGIDLCRKKKIDFILAVGGGSVIDSAKAIAIGVPYQGDFFDLFEKKLITNEALKIATIPTVGTGSESSPASIITHTDKKAKIGYSNPVLMPLFTIMNPELTMTLGKYATSCSIVDAITHVTERYFTNTQYVDCTDRIGEGLVQSLIKYALLVHNDPANYDIRAEIMWASKLAHDNVAGFGRKQDWSLHAIAYEIGAIYDFPHGAIMGVLLPYWMNYVGRTNIEKIMQFSKRVFGDDVSPSEVLWKFLERIEMPTSLRGLGIKDKTKFNEIAEWAVRFNPSKTIGNYVRLAPSDIVNILQIAF